MKIIYIDLDGVIADFDKGRRTPSRKCFAI